MAGVPGPSGAPADLAARSHAPRQLHLKDACCPNRGASRGRGGASVRDVPTRAARGRQCGSWGTGHAPSLAPTNAPSDPRTSRPAVRPQFEFWRGPARQCTTAHGAREPGEPRPQLGRAAAGRPLPRNGDCGPAMCAGAQPGPPPEGRRKGRRRVGIRTRGPRPTGWGRDRKRAAGPGVRLRETRAALRPEAPEAQDYTASPRASCDLRPAPPRPVSPYVLTPGGA